MDKTKDFLLELGTEELPFSAQQVVLNEAKNILKGILERQKLAFKDIEIFVSPTRIVVVLKKLAVSQTTENKEIAGPPKRIAYDEKGNPTGALLGFIKKANIDIKDIKEKETDKGVYLYAKTETKAVLASQLLPEICADFISKLLFAKMMVWNSSGFRFIRPIRWILALFGTELLDVEIAGISAEKFSYGIGGVNSEKIKVSSIDDYLQNLDEIGLILDYSVRKKQIAKQINQIIKNCGQLVENDEDLLKEVTALVEYPTAVLCDFSRDFLKLPNPVVYTVLKHHQKCFALCDEKGKFIPYFVAICNGNGRDLDIVKEGYEKVASARLNDADFFYKQDKKIALRDRTRKLKTLVFQEKLGSVYDKLVRMKKIAAKIFDDEKIDKVDDEKIDKVDNEKIDKVIDLCKNDLLTDMVYEFPELQGIMGNYYAKASGESQYIAQAIEDHYLPKFVGDDLPKTLIGAIASISDKIDNIVATFVLGKKPSGSKDPFGIRRQIYGIFNIVEDRNLDIDILELIKLSLNIFKNKDKKVLGDLEEFFNQRLENWLLDRGIRIDVARSVIFDRKKCKPVEVLIKANFIMKIINEANFLSVIGLYKRANNILKKSNLPKNWVCKEKLLEKKEEKKLYAHVEFLSRTYLENLPNSLKAFSSDSLRDNLHNFFENVMVMDEDINLRNNRLAILNMLIERFKVIADFSEISVE